MNAEGRYGRGGRDMCRIRKKTAIVLGVGASLILLLTACAGPPVTRDAGDTSAPELSLTVTAAKEVDTGLLTVPFGKGKDIELTMPGGTITVKADDPGGVSYVELWMTIGETCPIGDDLSQSTPGGLTGKPAARAEGEVTDTQAPSSLTVGYDINTLDLQSGCIYRFTVWGQAANAATTPVMGKSSTSSLTLRS
ncbi:hypothetical protein ACFWN7_12220 [Agromyces sp. NPDC058484]|uniref:hypothetical protein n=1 Tax=Agromyces sp. NPDC058484 TaxID=3346524 RepID=UPI003655575C